MTAWSRSEASRTIEEVKRRSATDSEFRALALSDAIAALAKINPRPIPVGSVRFVEAVNAAEETNQAQFIVAVLPEFNEAHDELSEEDLEQVAGGGSSGGTPPPLPPPVGLS